MTDLNLPMYMRVVVFLREGILTGKYPDGKVPATAFLTRRFHTSSTTVSNAYAELEKDGLIARGPYRPGIRQSRVCCLAWREACEVQDLECAAGVLGDAAGLLCEAGYSVYAEQGDDEVGEGGPYLGSVSGSDE